MAPRNRIYQTILGVSKQLIVGFGILMVFLDNMDDCYCLHSNLRPFVVSTPQITRENYGMTEVMELVPGGESISVDKNNR